MTTLARPIPKITKQYRLCWRLEDAACYITVTAEGSELLILAPGKPASIHAIVGVCIDCMFGAGCSRPDCPSRNRGIASAEVVDHVAAPLRAVERDDLPVQERPHEGFAEQARPEVIPVRRGIEPPGMWHTEIWDRR
jgi:hypothetical protein